MHDNPALLLAAKSSQYLLPVYIFDPADYRVMDIGVPKTGAFRARFLIECLDDLRDKLKNLTSDLKVLVGSPAQVLEQLCRKYQIQTVYAHRGYGTEEQACQRTVAEVLQNVNLQLMDSNFLYYPDQLSFAIKDLPDVFTTFRKRIEKEVADPKAVAAPTNLPPLPANYVNDAAMPNLELLGLADPVDDDRCQFRFKGGETEAVNRLTYYTYDSQHILTYKDTRNHLLGKDFSTRFSAWLAAGAISPRRIFETVRSFEREIAANRSTYWVLFELIWRDYFRYVLIRHGGALFKAGGIRDNKIPVKDHREGFRAWQNGATGIPFIDANMQELQSTGYMSNRGRQNVASFLVKDLNIDWRLGAKHFESFLIDYDVASNYGNWNYVAGIGNDPRETRYFNILKQALQYDMSGAYVRHWLPALHRVRGKSVHGVPFWSEVKRRKSGVEDYPHPVIIPSSWDRYRAELN